jgi:PAS domain S-box-containing protein
VKEQKDFTHRLIAGEKITSLETQRVTKDGRILDVWLTLTKVMDDAGKPIGIASTERDITERKKEEANLRRLATVLRDSNDAITIQDFEGKILAWNHGAELMYGYSEHEALQKNIWLLTPPNRVKEQKDFTHRLIAGEKITSLETQRVTKDGRILDVWLTLTKVMDDAGKPIGIASTERDITERKWTEEKLHQYTMQLEQKSRDLEQIIYVTSHDLRSPLVNAQGFTKELAKSIMELMESVNTGDISAEAMRKMAPILKNDIPESLEYIQSSIARLDMQLSALLKLSRLGRAAITMENLDMNKTIAEVVKSLEYVVKEKEAYITVDELPPCRADFAQTNQIFLNLIENALKYLDPKRPGKIQIRGSKQGSDIVYCIEDNGIGIAPECRKKIFEIFYRVEQHECLGEGLGLTIVRQSAEKQRGTIWVESELGKGSKFFVKLPGI